MTSVQVYFNLHKHLWSIRQKGKIIAHVRTVLLRNCRFHVSESGRQRVLNDRRRRVHAWVIGDLVEMDGADPGWSDEVSYNPYSCGHFYHRDGMSPVHDASQVYFGERYCYLP